jgi:hypothetical protein
MVPRPFDAEPDSPHRAFLAARRHVVWVIVVRGRRRTLMALRSCMALYPSAAWSSGRVRSKTLPGVELAAPDAVDQVRQEAAYRCGAAVQMHLGEEQFFAG